MPAPSKGTIGWIDLTVEDAETIRDFYADVAGWSPEPVDMGGYSDFNMKSAETGQPVAGVCHARGTNAGLPAHWIVYITVEDVDASAQRCEAAGGKVLVAPKSAGGSARFCIIQDPAGAVAALYSP